MIQSMGPIMKERLFKKLVDFLHQALFFFDQAYFHLLFWSSLNSTSYLEPVGLLDVKTDIQSLLTRS